MAPEFMVDIIFMGPLYTNIHITRGDHPVGSRRQVCQGPQALKAPEPPRCSVDLGRKNAISGDEENIAYG